MASAAALACGHIPNYLQISQIKPMCMLIETKTTRGEGECLQCASCCWQDMLCLVKSVSSDKVLTADDFNKSRQHSTGAAETGVASFPALPCCVARTWLSC